MQSRLMAPVSQPKHLNPQRSENSSAYMKQKNIYNSEEINLCGSAVLQSIGVTLTSSV